MSSSVSASADDSNSSILSLIHNLLLEDTSNGRSQMEGGYLGSYSLDVMDSPGLRKPNGQNVNGRFSSDDLYLPTRQSPDAQSLPDFLIPQHSNSQADANDFFSSVPPPPAVNSHHHATYDSSKEAFSSGGIPGSSLTSSAQQLQASQQHQPANHCHMGNTQFNCGSAVRANAINSLHVPEPTLSSQHQQAEVLSSLPINSLFMNGYGGLTSSTSSMDPFRSFRSSPLAPIGREVAEEQAKHRFASGDHITGSNSHHHNQMCNGSNGTQSAFQMEKFESRIRIIANEIQSTIQQHVNGLQTRKEQLLQQLETIRKTYVEVFESRNRLRMNFMLGESDSDMDILPLPNVSFTKPDLALHKAVTSLGFLATPAFAPYCSVSGDALEGAVPGVNTSFMVLTKNCFNDELLIGREAITVQVYALSNSAAETPGRSSSEGNNNPSSTAYGHFSQAGGNSEAASSPFGVYTAPNSKPTNGELTKTVINHSLLDHNNGKYTVTYMVPVMRNVPERVVISVMVNGMPLNGSPFKVPVQTQQRQTWRKLLTFGSEGNAIGQFCRPWGVAIARMPQDLSPRRDSGESQSSTSPDEAHSLAAGLQPLPTAHLQLSSNDSTGMPGTSAPAPTSTNTDYLIAVADRSNNRVQLFKFDMKANQIAAINVFGSGPGTRQGQFDRPAGISFNMNYGHIIVADKDNHRVQVFDLGGRYLFKFGEKGNRIGQFCYPWDIDSCPSTNQILVSDTRNRRVQLFTPYGQYIMHFAQPLDSPRGVGFLGDKKLVVSDFNKHRLLIFDKFAREECASSSSSTASSSPPNAMSTRFVGFGEGSGWGEFLRPQGISVCGNFVFCADSRNNRICLYNLMTQVFEYLSDELNLDRPSGLAVMDNVLVVVDFGNNRLQICQR